MMKLFVFIILLRHPGEGRDQANPPAQAGPSPVPAFAGMTEIVDTIQVFSAALVSKKMCAYRRHKADHDGVLGSAGITYCAGTEFVFFWVPKYLKKSLFGSRTKVVPSVPKLFA